jgi:hypothetical protein
VILAFAETHTDRTGDLSNARLRATPAMMEKSAGAV